MDKHEKNLQLYLELGGDPKLAKRYKNASLENRAKISFFLSQMEKGNNSEVLQIKKEVPAIKQVEKEIIPETLDYKPSKPEFLGFVSQYPKELHNTYRDAYTYWIEVCGLKMQLNEVPDDDEDQAYIIQRKMFRLMEKFDRRKNALDHYKNFKRVLPVESKKDYSLLSPIQLIAEKQNLESLISKRKSTIERMKKALPDESDKTYKKKLDAINLKVEALEEKILDFENLKEIIKN